MLAALYARPSRGDELSTYPEAGSFLFWELHPGLKVFKVDGLAKSSVALGFVGRGSDGSKSRGFVAGHIHAQVAALAHCLDVPRVRADRVTVA